MYDRLPGEYSSDEEDGDDNDGGIYDQTPSIKKEKKKMKKEASIVYENEGPTEYENPSEDEDEEDPNETIYENPNDTVYENPNDTVYENPNDTIYENPEPRKEGGRKPKPAVKKPVPPAKPRTGTAGAWRARRQESSNSDGGRGGGGAMRGKSSIKRGGMTAGNNFNFAIDPNLI